MQVHPKNDNVTTCTFDWCSGGETFNILMINEQSGKSIQTT